MVKRIMIFGMLAILSFSLVSCFPEKKESDMGAELENRIRRDYFQRFEDPEFTLKDVDIHGYFGTYRDSVAVMMAIRGVNLPPESDVVVVAGYEFYSLGGWPILIWNDGDFYDLLTAYNETFISVSDLETICGLQNYQNK